MSKVFKIDVLAVSVCEVMAPSGLAQVYSLIMPCCGSVFQPGLINYAGEFKHCPGCGMAIEIGVVISMQAV